MLLTPQDLRRARFGAALRGFNRNEVASFLEEVADDLELALRNAERARQEVSALRDQLAEHGRREATPPESVLDAQRVSSELRQTAKRDAERIVREAREQADEIVRLARARCGEVERELTALRQRRHDAEASLEDSIATLRTALDVVKQQDRGVGSSDTVRERHRGPTMAARQTVSITDGPTVRRIRATVPGSSA